MVRLNFTTFLKSSICLHLRISQGKVRHNQYCLSLFAAAIDQFDTIACGTQERCMSFGLNKVNWDSTEHLREASFAPEGIHENVVSEVGNNARCDATGNINATSC